MAGKNYRVQVDSVCALGYNGGPLHALGDAVLYLVGNCINQVPYDDLYDVSKAWWGPGDPLGCMGVDGESGLVAIAESKANPAIYVFQQGDKQVPSSLKDGAELGYKCMALSRGGRWLVSVADLPDESLILWDTSSGQVLCREQLLGTAAKQLKSLECESVKSLSQWTSCLFSPQDGNFFVIAGKEKLIVCEIERTHLHYRFKRTILSVPDSDSDEAVTFTGTIAWAPGMVIYAGTSDGRVVVVKRVDIFKEYDVVTTTSDSKDTGTKHTDHHAHQMPSKPPLAGASHREHHQHHHHHTEEIEERTWTAEFLYITPDAETIAAMIEAAAAAEQQLQLQQEQEPVVPVTQADREATAEMLKSANGVSQNAVLADSDDEQEEEEEEEEEEEQEEEAEEKSDLDSIQGGATTSEDDRGSSEALAETILRSKAEAYPDALKTAARGSAVCGLVVTSRLLLVSLVDGRIFWIRLASEAKPVASPIHEAQEENEELDEVGEDVDETKTQNVIVMQVSVEYERLSLHKSQGSSTKDLFKEACKTLLEGTGITQMVVSPRYDRVLLGLSTGLVLTFPLTDSLNEQSITFTPLVSAHANPIGCLTTFALPPAKWPRPLCASVSDDNIMMLWDVKIPQPPQLIGALKLPGYAGEVVTKISVSGNAGLAVIGTNKGFIRLVDISPFSSRVFFELRVVATPISALSYHSTAAYIAVASEQKVYFISGTPMSRFKVLGYTQTPANVTGLQWTDSQEGPMLFISTLQGDIVRVQPPSQEYSPEGNYKLGNYILRKTVVRSEFPITSISLHPNLKTAEDHVWAQCADLKIRRYSMALETKGSDLMKAETLEKAGIAVPGCEFPGDTLAISNDHTLVAAASADGSVVITPTAVEAVAEIEPQRIKRHDPMLGGTAAVAFTPDLRSPALITGGRDGAMFVFKVTSSPSLIQAVVRTELSVRAQPQAPPFRQQNEWGFMKGLKTITMKAGDSPLPLAFLEKLAHTREEAELSSHLSVQERTLDKLNKLQAQLQELVAKNEKAPEIEKLKRSEFLVDFEMRDLVLQKGEDQIALVREEVENQNRAMGLVRERIKQECWEIMQVKGRAIVGVLEDVVVYNYPLTKLKQRVLDDSGFETRVDRDLGIIKSLRSVEIQAARQCRSRGITTGETLSTSVTGKGKASAFVDATEESGFTQGSLIDLSKFMQATGSQAQSKKMRGLTKPPGADDEEEDEDADGLDGMDGGVPVDMILYHPYELYTRKRKVIQMKLLKALIRKRKSDYNLLFDQVVKEKRQALDKLDDRNQRIKEICDDLENKPTLIKSIESEEEHPESCFTVNDSEIKVARILSDAEKKRLAEEEAAELERKRAQNADTATKRALDEMMSGTLQVKTEQTLEDLKAPDFIDLPPEELNDEQAKAVKEFRQKQAAMMEEREKYRKSLETELKRATQQAKDICAQFDKRLRELLGAKIAADLEIVGLQLSVINIAQALLEDEEAERNITRLRALAGQVRMQVAEKVNERDAFQVQVETLSEYEEKLSQDEKAYEKQIRKEFSDYEGYADAMIRLYRRRRKAEFAVSMADLRVPFTVPAGTGPASNTSSGATLHPFNGYGTRYPNVPPKQPVVQDLRRGLSLKFLDPSLGSPTASSSRPHNPNVTEEMLDDHLNEDEDKPEDMPQELWHRIVEARATKIEKEAEMRVVSYVVSEMKQRLSQLITECEELTSKLEKVSRRVSQISEGQIGEKLNVPILFRFKQGQVEVPQEAVVNDFTDAMLIRKEEVEALNALVVEKGENKIGILSETKDFRRFIHNLHWENSQLEFKAEDIVLKTRDFQLLRVTKDLQAMIKTGGGGDSERHAIELKQLQKKLEHSVKTHQEKLKEFEKVEKKLARDIKRKTKENSALDTQIDDLEAKVAERQRIYEIQSMQSGLDAESSKQRLKEVAYGRRLKDVDEAQNEELTFLRAELDRLRRRTFPSFAAGTNSRRGNPDERRF